MSILNWDLDIYFGDKKSKVKFSQKIQIRQQFETVIYTWVIFVYIFFKRPVKYNKDIAHVSYLI